MPIRKRQNMTDTDWEELDAAVQSKLPGQRVVRRSVGAEAGADAASSALPPDTGTPDLEVLRAKYLRRPRGPAAEPAAGPDAVPPAADAGQPEDDAIVAVESVDASPRDSGSRTRTVVVNRRGDVVGAQG